MSFQMVRDNLPYWKLLSALAFQNDALECVAEVLAEHKEKSINAGIDLFTRMGATDPLKETFLFAATIDGILLHYIHMQENYPLDEMIQFLEDSYFREDRFKN